MNRTIFTQYPKSQKRHWFRYVFPSALVVIFAYCMQVFELTEHSEVPWLINMALNKVIPNADKLSLILFMGMLVSMVMVAINSIFNHPKHEKIRVAYVTKWVARFTEGTFSWLTGFFIAIVLASNLIYFFPQIDAIKFLTYAFVCSLYAPLFRYFYYQSANWSVQL